MSSHVTRIVGQSVCQETYINRLISATNSSTIADTEIGTSSSLLKMQITREELGATFTCKVNSPALVEPLTVDIKPDIHGEYTHPISQE